MTTTWHDLTDQLQPKQIDELVPPPGALTVEKWENTRDGGRQRYFTGTVRRVGPATVTISGMQFSDGRCERWVSVRDGLGLTLVQARELETALHDAADEVDTAV